MRILPRKGISTFYADESDNKEYYVIACVCIPTFTPTDGGLHYEWDDYLRQAIEWRKGIKEKSQIPIAKELKGSKLATGRNQYLGGISALYGRPAIEAYSHALQTLSFLPSKSVFSIWAKRGYTLFGHTRLEAALYAMFQRMQKQCQACNSSAMIFFDEGHNEYRTLFRRACVHLPTGSKVGAWADGKSTKNIPFDRSLKDANFKDSRYSQFVQIADLVAYATLLKAKLESNTLSDKEKNLRTGHLHDSIPRSILNTLVQYGGQDGIKRLQ